VEEEEEEYKRMELPGKYMAKLLYEWNDQRFEEEYLNKLEKNWKKWKRDRQIDENKYLKRLEERCNDLKLELRLQLWQRLEKG